ncbi:MAG: hypothetical protein ACR2P0_07015 [Acidimicrobiales bacterium]
MPVDSSTPLRRRDDRVTVLACSDCEVTWRDEPTAPCWYCGNPGHEAKPERVVVD